MTTSVQYPHISQPESGSPCLERWPRTRVLDLAMDHVGRGWAVEEIARQYPHLSPSEIHSALAYYFDHEAAMQEAIRAELKQEEVAATESRSSPLSRRLAALLR